MRYPIVIEPGNSTTAWGVIVPDLPGCFSAGETLDEAMIQAEDAITGWIESAIDDGENIPAPSHIEELRIAHGRIDRAQLRRWRSATLARLAALLLSRSAGLTPALTKPAARGADGTGTWLSRLLRPPRQAAGPLISAIGLPDQAGKGDPLATAVSLIAQVLWPRLARSASATLALVLADGLLTAILDLYHRLYPYLPLEHDPAWDAIEYRGQRRPWPEHPPKADQAGQDPGLPDSGMRATPPWAQQRQAASRTPDDQRPHSALAPMAQAATLGASIDQREQNMMRRWLAGNGRT